MFSRSSVLRRGERGTIRRSRSRPLDNLYVLESEEGSGWFSLKRKIYLKNCVISNSSCVTWYHDSSKGFSKPDLVNVGLENETLVYVVGMERVRICIWCEYFDIYHKRYSYFLLSIYLCDPRLKRKDNYLFTYTSYILKYIYNYMYFYRIVVLSPSRT